MIIERFYDDKLAQAAYLIGCAATGDALIVDPNRDVAPIIEAADRHRVRITHVTETHIHADFVSGARELAARTGARLHLSGEGGEAWRYRFAEEDGAVLLHDGDEIRVGNIRVKAIHTPGHTPEHLCFLVTDTAGADRPMGIVTGDFVFVGDVGRPDLLERAAGSAGTMDGAARQLFASLRRFARELPDYLQIWPGHGAGSACGKSLGAVPQTTVGYEKLFNWAFQIADEDEFVAAVLEGQPEPPAYFAEMKRINRDGPRRLDGFTAPPRLPDAGLEPVLRHGAAVLDVRGGQAFAAAHVPGTYHAPYASRSFLTWAGSVLPFDRELYIVADDEAPGVARDLALIGFDRVAGAFSTTAVRSWLDAHPGAPAEVDDVEPDHLSELGEQRRPFVLDVRNPSEWQEAHIPGGRNVPLGRLTRALDEIPRDRPLVVHCQTGPRALVAIAALQAHGFTDLHHLHGGFARWSREARDVETAETAPSTAV